MSYPSTLVQSTTCDKNYRKLIAARFTVTFSFFIAFFFTLYNYFDNNERLYYLDLGLLVTLISTTLIAHKKNIFFLANILLFIMVIALIALIYINKGQDGVMYWGYISIFLFMTFFGHKKGAVLSSLLFTVFFIMAFFWIGESSTYQAYVRFVVSSVILILIAFFYEFSIHKVINKLDGANSSLQKLSRIDGLTNLYNRRYFDETFSGFLNISKREKKLTAFALLDIDHFKDFNDLYGHQAGDEVLKRIAQTFKKEMLRPNDYIFRLGGEEFGILFTTRTADNALKKIQKVLTEIKALDIEHTASQAATQVTVSAGLFVEHYKTNTAPETIYKNSDNALYQAKRSGRNQVVIYQS